MPLRRVLVVDDEISIRLNLQAFLEDEGHHVLIASSGEQALVILQNEPIDYLIVDMRLPHMDGNTVIIEALKLQPDLHCIIHTGSVEYRVPPALLRLSISQSQVLLKPLKDMQALNHFFQASSDGPI